MLENAACVVVTGGDTALAQAALAAPDPAVVVLQTSGGALPPFHPAAQKATDRAAAFVCQSGDLRLAGDHVRRRCALCCARSLKADEEKASFCEQKEAKKFC